MLAATTKLTLKSAVALKSFATCTMSVQSGILPEGDSSAYFGTYKVNYEYLSTPKGKKTFIDAVKGFNNTLAAVGKEHDASVTGTVSFGNKLWKTLIADNEALKNTASELIDFPGYGKAPSTQDDFYIHIHSKKQDATLDASLHAVDLFGPQNSLISVTDEKNGFLYKDARDLTGFIDGSANPHGPEKRTAAAFGEDKSSYVLVQRYIHNLAKWATVDEKEQQNVIGRTKPDSVELKPMPHLSHVERTDLKENGKGLKIVRHSLPYLEAGGNRGLWFTAYCGTMYNLETILKSMNGKRDGFMDRLLEYITPVTGGYYFVPTLDQIEKL
ncbi:hypothetical protein WA158_000019 [Blastocystis sp. Blastoise]